MKKLFVLLVVLALVTSLFVSCVDDDKTEDMTDGVTSTEEDTCENIYTLGYDPNEPPIIVTDEFGNEEWITVGKPVIYLYPEEKTDVEVKLDFNGELYCTYPKYNDGWSVTAYPNGTIIDKTTGREYSYLFWDGFSDVEYDMSRGFVVKGEDTAEFLQDILAKMGLTPKEYNEFIVYWLPLMQNNPYNLIAFQTDAYTDNAKLEVTPAPDSVLRVFMTYKALEAPVEVEEPVIKPFVREGFCLVEWGGAQIK